MSGSPWHYAYVEGVDTFEELRTQSSWQMGGGAARRISSAGLARRTTPPTRAHQHTPNLWPAPASRAGKKTTLP